MHETEVAAHGEGRSEDLAHAKSDVVAIVRVPLSRPGRIVGTPISGRFIFEFLLVRVSSVEPRLIAQVVVNADAILGRVVGAEACGAPVIRQQIVDRRGIKVDQFLANRVNAIYGIRQIVTRNGIANPGKLPYGNRFSWVSVRNCAGGINLPGGKWIINLSCENGATQSICPNVATQ